MKFHHILGLFCSTCVLFLLSATASVAQDGIGGDWKGLLKTGSIDLRTTVHIAGDANALTGKIDLLDQSMMGLPLTNVVFADSSLQFDLNTSHYAGRLQADGTIKGSLMQPGIEMGLDLERGEWVIVRSQTPQAPFPYTVTDVTYPNAQAEGVTLAGTLTVPTNVQNYPVVVLSSGSGPQNRDSELLMHKPFWIIADYLGRHGIGVLRYDDRGVGASTGKHAMATSADFATDVLAGVQYLKSRSDLPISKIGLMGHSEGGIIVPMVAVQSSDVDFIILLAGTGVRGDLLLAEQTELVMRSSGSPEDEIAKSRKSNADIYRIIVKSKTMKQAKDKIEKYMAQAAKTDTTITTASTKAMISQINNVWFRYFLKYDPATTLEQVKCPVFAINGDKDVQVPVEMNLTAIAAALQKGGNTHFKTQSFPGLNHLFQHCTTCSVNEYGLLEETFAPEVLEAVVAWIGVQLRIEN
jgi:uncharacterized protein